MLALIAAVLFVCMGFDDDPSMLGDFEWLAAGLTALALHFVLNIPMFTLVYRRQQ